jgi:hypothetical protein
MCLALLCSSPQASQCRSFNVFPDLLDEPGHGHHSTPGLPIPSVRHYWHLFGITAGLDLLAPVIQSQGFPALHLDAVLANLDVIPTIPCLAQLPLDLKPQLISEDLGQLVLPSAPLFLAMRPVIGIDPQSW